MINQSEVPIYLEEALPCISAELKSYNTVCGIYRSIHVFLDYTVRQIRTHNLRGVKKCFYLADKLYSNGNTTVKNALENVYVYSFSTFPVSTADEKKQLMGLIPGSLYSVYLKQVTHFGV